MYLGFQGGNIVFRLLFWAWNHFFWNEGSGIKCWVLLMAALQELLTGEARAFSWHHLMDCLTKSGPASMYISRARSRLASWWSHSHCILHLQTWTKPNKPTAQIQTCLYCKYLLFYIRGNFPDWPVGPISPHWLLGNSISNWYLAQCSMTQNKMNKQNWRTVFEHLIYARH